MIMAVVYQAGSARSILPVIKAWQLQTGEPFEVFSFPEAASVFEAEGLQISRIERIDQLPSFAELGPRLLITGTSRYPEIESNLWRDARSLGVPCLAILDNWNNLWRRFTHPCDARRYNSTPTKIAVMDELTRSEMLAEGCPEEKIAVTGQPALDVYFESGFYDRKAAREKLGLEDKASIILFVGEAIQSLNTGRNSLAYTDESVFADILAALDSINWPNVVLLKKLHPAETVNPALAARANGFPKIEIVRGDGRLWASAADLVIGMTSILLVEAILMRKLVCSHRPAAVDLPLMLRVYDGKISRTNSIAQLSDWLARARTLIGAEKNVAVEGGEGLATMKVISLCQALCAESIASEKPIFSDPYGTSRRS